MPRRQAWRYFALAVSAGVVSFSAILPFSAHIPRDVSQGSYLPLNLLYMTLSFIGLLSSLVPRSRRVLDSDMSCVTLFSEERPPEVVV